MSESRFATSALSVKLPGIALTPATLATNGFATGNEFTIREEGRPPRAASPKGFDIDLWLSSLEDG